ncbi:MAG: AI-2E family transporter, partial [Chloroflexota bacterium]
MDNQPPPPDRQNSYSTAPPWQPAAARNYWVILLITLLVLLLLFWPVIPFLFFAIVLAYLTIPVVRFLQNRLFGGKRRGAAIAITFVLTFVLFIVGILAFVPPIIEQTQAVATSLPGTLENLISTPIRIGGDADADPFVIRDWLTQQERGEQFVSMIDGWNADSERGELSAGQVIGGSLSQLQFDTFGFLTSAVQFFLQGIFFVFVLVYLWSGWENMVELVLSLPPDDYQDDMRRLLWELGNVWNSYLRGEIIVASVMGTLAWALAFVVGLPNPLFIGFLVGLLEFIPNIGPGLAAGVLGSTALVNSSANFPALSGVPLAIIVLIIWVIMLQFQGAVLTPRVLGDSLRLHPIIVILAVLWGAAIGGVVGIIIAGPIVATLR